MTQLCQFKNGQPRKLRRGQEIPVPGNKGGFITVGSRANLDKGIYWLIEQGPLPGRHEYPGLVVHVLEGDSVTTTRTVISKAPEQIAQVLKTEIKNRRDEIAFSGINWSPEGASVVYPVKTNDKSQARLGNAIDIMERTSAPDQIWKMMAKPHPRLTLVEMSALGVAVAVHVNDCFEREIALEELIDDVTEGTDSDALKVAALLALDTKAGWPDLFEREVV